MFQAEEYFKNIEVGKKHFLRNLVIYPVFSKVKNADIGNYIALDSAILEKDVDVLETGDINTTRFVNRADAFVIGILGESIIGAMQDRIVNSTVVIEPGAEVIAPVSCIEQKRWSGNEYFSYSKYLAYPALRSLLQTSVHHSLQKGNQRASDQQSIWKSIAEAMKSINVHSHTMSLVDAYEGINSEIERYVEEFGEQRTQFSGFIVYSEDRFVSFDFFGSVMLLNQYREKLIKSYAFEGVLLRYGIKEQKNINTKPGVFRDLLQATPLKHYSGVGACEEYTATVQNISISITVGKGGEMLYATALPEYTYDS